MEVDVRGNFHIDRNDFVSGNGTLDIIQTGDPNGAPDDAVTAGVLITNDPVNLINIRLGKEWEGIM